MKTKDNLLKGIIIGIFVIVVPLILMSTTNYTTVNGEVGRYQISTSSTPAANWSYETILDTKTGEVTSRKVFHINNFQEIKK